VATTAALFAGRGAPASAGTPAASPRAAAPAAPGSRPGTAAAGSSAAAAASPLRGSHATLRSSSCALAPAGDVVRTRYTPLSSDEDDDEAELEARLMRKYGLAR
jgi:hypothetical protein